MTGVARLFVKPLIAGAIYVLGNSFLADYSAASRHDFRLGALGLLAVTLALTLLGAVEFLSAGRRTRSMRSMPPLPHRHYTSRAESYAPRTPW
jgi:hypothetical protein